MKTGRFVGPVVALALFAWLRPGPACAGPANASSSMFDVRVPGGIQALFAASGVRGAPEPSLALLSLIRAVYGYRGITEAQAKIRNAILTHLNSVQQPAADDDVMPLPLSPDFWTSVVFGGKVTREGLLPAILADRRAALCYYGLMSLDDPTLAYLSEHAALLTAILDQPVPLPVFAVYGRSIHVRNGAVVVPGGPRAQPLWEAVVGAPAKDAPRFILALLSRDEGRCAYFYDTIAHLDVPRQAFAFGFARPADASQRFRALYSAFGSFEARTWRVVDFLFSRRPHDPASVLMRLAVTEQGELSAPAAMPLWKAVFDGRVSGCRNADISRAGPPADAAWMIERLSEENADRRAWLLETIGFAQRTLGPLQAALSDGAAVCETLVAFPTYQGLLVTLETIGGFSLQDYTTIVRSAANLPADTFGAYLAQLQGALTIVQRAAAVRSLTVPAARKLVLALFAFDPQQLTRTQYENYVVDGRPATWRMQTVRGAMGHVAEWMTRQLLPALDCGSQPAEDCLAGAAAGAAVKDPVVITWEAEQYRLDYRAAGRERARRVRERQQANRLSDVLALFAVVRALLNPAITAGEAGRQAATLTDLAGRLTLQEADRFGGRAPSFDRVFERTREMASRLPRVDRSARVTVLADLLDLADVLLADTLASFAYTIAIGDPESSMMLAGDPARRHDFGRLYRSLKEPNGPWRVAEERKMPDGVWLVQGSLLGLNRVLAQFSVRRLSVDAEGMPATLEQKDVNAFAESALALNPVDLTDTVRDRLLEGIRRGRSRIAGLLGDPDAFGTLVTAVGISEWRYAAARWLARRPKGQPDRLFSLTELFWLGDSASGANAEETATGPRAAGTRALDAWGAATRSMDGSWSSRLPRGLAWEGLAGRRIPGLLATQVADLHLRIAECLAQLKLPSALVPGVAGYAAWDLTMQAQMTDEFDWLAVVRAAQSLSSERVTDYVSALTAPDGPLVPVRQPTRQQRPRVTSRWSSSTSPPARARAAREFPLELPTSESPAPSR